MFGIAGTLVGKELCRESRTAYGVHIAFKQATLCIDEMRRRVSSDKREDYRENRGHWIRTVWPYAY